MRYLQLLTGEQQNKITQPVPILGMLQASKANIQTIDMKMMDGAKAIPLDNNHIEPGDDVDYTNKDGNPAENADKNPIINKRILLRNDSVVINLSDDQLNDEQIKIKHVRSTDEFSNLLNTNDTDQVVVVQVPESVFDKDDAADKDRLQQYDITKTQFPFAPRPPTEGRIVVYGDSNCLDSTHMDKPCFWLLDALLEYTMTSHVSTLLKDLNRTSTIAFDATKELPLRLPNNNLHLYSKVLETGSGTTTPVKRAIPTCTALRWELPIFLNVTAPNDLYHSNVRDSDNELDGNVGALRRRLESQKGEVRSYFVVRFIIFHHFKRSIM